MARSSVRLTYEDYCAIPEDGKRHEIIAGDEYVSPSPGFLHQLICERLSRALAEYCESQKMGVVLTAPFDVAPSREDVMQPDVLYIARARMPEIRDTHLEGAPDLAIEIISPATRRVDEVVKRQRYEKFGVQEYWLIDPENRSATIYRRAGECFAPALEIAEAGALASPLLPGLSIALAPLFADPRRA